jgi:hypothetical protein
MGITYKLTLVKIEICNGLSSRSTSFSSYCIILVSCPFVARVIFFKNIKIHIFMWKEKNKNENNLVININFNYEYIINVK